MTNESPPPPSEGTEPPVAHGDLTARHIELETYLAEQQRQVVEHQEQTRKLIEALQADSRRQYKISLGSVALAALLVVAAFSSLKQQQATSAAQSGQIADLTTDLKESIGFTATKLDEISTELGLVGNSTQQVADQDATALSLPPTLRQISPGCGEVDLDRGTIRLSNPRQCDAIEVSVSNPGINPVAVTAYLRIGGRYNLKCEPHEQSATIPAQKETTFIFYVGACLAAYRSSFSGPAEGRVELEHETL